MKVATDNGIMRLWSNVVKKLKGECISYDNTSSKLEATTVQGAIDEVKGTSDNIVTNQLGNCYLKYEDGKYYIGHDTAETETEV